MAKREHLSEREIERLRKVGERQRDRIMVRVLLDTGMRLGEIGALQVNDVDVEEGNEGVYVGKTAIWAYKLDQRFDRDAQDPETKEIVTKNYPLYSNKHELQVMLPDGQIVRGTPKILAEIVQTGEVVKMSPKSKKTGSGRTIPLVPGWEDHKETIELLRGFIHGREKNDWLFKGNYKGTHKRLSMTGTRQIILRMMGVADLPDHKRMIHVLRHTYAWTCIRRKVSIRVLQRNMGHSTIKTTELYLEMDATDAREEMGRAYGSVSP